jgi:rod shape-determining protein MreD
VNGGRRWGFWVLVAGLFLAHFVLHVGFGLGRSAPDLLTIGLLLAAREVGLGTAAALGFAFGLVEDSLSVLAFGANTVAMTAVGILGTFTRDLFVGDSLLFVVSYFFAGKWVRDFIHWIMVGETLRQPFLEQVVVQGMIGATYAAVVGLVLVTLVGRPREL